MQRFENVLLISDREVRNEAALKVNDWVREDRQRHQRQLDGLLEKYALDDMSHQVHLLKGEAKSLIPALARDKQAELIVMGTVCRTGVAALFVGNTAEKVLQQADSSVLTVKPDGFVSLVTLGKT